jgi:hypothetical protein
MFVVCQQSVKIDQTVMNIWQMIVKTFDMFSNAEIQKSVTFTPNFRLFWPILDFCWNERIVKNSKCLSNERFPFVLFFIMSRKHLIAEEVSLSGNTNDEQNKRVNGRSGIQ